MNGNCASHFGSGRVFDKFRKEVVLSEGGSSFDPGILGGIVLPEMVVGIDMQEGVYGVITGSRRRPFSKREVF